MRKWTGIVALTLLIACHGRDRAAPPQADPAAWIASLLRRATNDSDLARMAIERGQSPRTRAAAAVIARESAALEGELNRLGRKHKPALPQQQDDKRIALKENLEILRSDLFDRAYALAMVQETDDLLRTLDSAEKADDPDIRQLALHHRPMIVEERRIANELLKQTGGAPWPGFKP